MRRWIDAISIFREVLAAMLSSFQQAAKGSCVWLRHSKVKKTGALRYTGIARGLH
jgi:hypothetical protein